MAQHARLGPSGASRWLTCPASIRLTEGLPNVSSPAAAMGTLCHELAEDCLNGGHDADYFKTDPRFESLTHREFGWAQMYVDYVREQGLEQVFVEQRMKLTDECWGTSDVVGFRKKVGVIIDGKYGQGRVEAFENPQLMIYGLMMLDEFDHLFGPFDTVEMHIVQPPLDNISVYTLPVEELLKWRDEVLLPGIAAVDAPEPKYGPSEKACKFCLAKGFCKARAEKNLQAAREEFGAVCPSPDVLTPDQVAEILPQIDEISSWCDDIRAYAVALAMRGEPPSGWKVVEGRSQRRWVDEQAVIKLLMEDGFDEDELYTKKPLGITAAEKLVGRKHPVFALCDKPQGAPTLVPESDPREPMAVGAASDFSEPV